MLKKFIIKVIRALGYHFFYSYFEFEKKKISPIGKYYIDEKKDSYEFFKKHFSTSLLIEDLSKIRDFAIKESLRNIKTENSKGDFLFMEFGVFNGGSVNLFAKILEKENLNIYGFDSFKGLKEHWLGTHNPINKFDRDGKPPKVRNNVKLIVGEVQNTIGEFLDKNKKNINFVHMDLDTYESSKFILKSIKPFLKNGCILLFDEFYNITGWRNGEYKALSETFEEKEYQYIAFGHQQVAIKFIKKI